MHCTSRNPTVDEYGTVYQDVTKSSTHKTRVKMGYDKLLSQSTYTAVFLQRTG